VTQEPPNPREEATNNELAQMIAQYEALPPDVAAAFVEMLERRRRDTAKAEATIREIAGDDTLRSILRRQVQAMDAIQASFEPVVLFPDFSGDDFSQLESAVLGLLPRTTDEVENVERIVVEASADPENRKFIAEVANRLPDRSKIVRMATWVGFLMVASYLIEIAPEMNANRIAMLAVAVAVWAVLDQRSRS
jgi:hypothetical protein